METVIGIAIFFVVLNYVIKDAKLLTFLSLAALGYLGYGCYEPSDLPGSIMGIGAILVLLLSYQMSITLSGSR